MATIVCVYFKDSEEAF